MFYTLYAIRDAIRNTQSLCSFVPLCLSGIFTTVEESLQINSFMQNEPNYLDEQMNVNKVLTKDYEKNSNWTLGENEPKTNPIKAN